jgi:hypothetical protein
VHRFFDELMYAVGRIMQDLGCLEAIAQQGPGTEPIHLGMKLKADKKLVLQLAAQFFDRAQLWVAIAR